MMVSLLIGKGRCTKPPLVCLRVLSVLLPADSTRKFSTHFPLPEEERECATDRACTAESRLEEEVIKLPWFSSRGRVIWRYQSFLSFFHTFVRVCNKTPEKNLSLCMTQFTAASLKYAQIIRWGFLICDAELAGDMISRNSLNLCCTALSLLLKSL